MVAIPFSTMPRWAWFFLPLPWAIGAALGLSNAMRDFRIAERQQMAVAVVTAHHVDDHQSYDLRLEMGGTTYVGRVYPSYGSYSVGERVTAYFDPQAPQTMSITSFEKRGRSELGPARLALLGIIVLECFAIYQWRRRPKPSQLGS